MPATLASDLQALTGPNFNTIGGQYTNDPNLDSTTTYELNNYKVHNPGSPLIRAVNSLEWVMSNWNGHGMGVNEVTRQDIINVLSGKSASGSEGLSQSSDPSCSTLATLNALSLTKDGGVLESEAITHNNDGTFTVHFPGNLNISGITITKADIAYNLAHNNEPLGNENMQILITALGKYISHGPSGISNGNLMSSLIFQLFTGNQGIQFGEGTQASVSGLEQFFRNAAPHVGKDMAITMGGHANDDGTVTFGGVSATHMAVFSNHVVTVSNIDLSGPDGGTITYINPWYSNKQFKIPLGQLSWDMGNFPQDDGVLWALPLSGLP